MEISIELCNTARIDHIVHTGHTAHTDRTTLADGEMTHTLKLDARIYELEDIQRATYKFANKASSIASFDHENPNQLIVEFRLLPSFKGDIEHIKMDYLIELNDQLLRRKVKKETEDIRNIILSHTFSKIPRS